jgi:hypothetical protein
MNFRLDFKMSLLILLIVITIITILDNRNLSDSLKAQKKEKEILTEKVDELESELKIAEELKGKYKDLEDSLSVLGEELSALKTLVPYQDFLDAKNTIEEYKKMNTFQEATQYIAPQNGTGFTAMDRENNCPCSFSFNGSNVEWLPNVVSELDKFRIEKEKIILTYQTVESLPHDYQFVMIKDLGMDNDDEKRWRIKEIVKEDKE